MCRHEGCQHGGQIRSDLSRLGVPDHRTQYALDHEFLRGNQVREFRILRLEIRFAAFDQECLERVLPVNQGRHDLTRTRLGSVLKHPDVAVANVPDDHRVTRDPERERVPRRLEPNGLNRHRDTFLGFLFPVAAKTRRDASEQRDHDDGFADRLERLHRTEGARLARFGG